MLHEILFFLFAAGCVGGAINLLAQKHPINSALSLIVVMASLAGIFLLMGAEFVGAIQVIIYAGAIMVLFIFVIMLLNAGVEEHTKGSKIAIVLGVPGAAVVAVLMAWGLLHAQNSAAPISIGELHGDGASIGRLLFGPYLLPFEVTSVLVLIAIMGAVVLARREDA
jgi:NADH-quinone oxidoreductase subunit J